MAVPVAVSRVLEQVAAERLPEVRLLRPQPGDVLVIRVGEHLSHSDLDDLVARARAVIAISDVSVMVLDPCSHIEVVRKDGA